VVTPVPTSWEGRLEEDENKEVGKKVDADFSFSIFLMYTLSLDDGDVILRLFVDEIGAAIAASFLPSKAGMKGCTLRGGSI
jgi:hypothetical protein